jgi:hypothetical protein
MRARKERMNSLLRGTHRTNEFVTTWNAQNEYIRYNETILKR